MKRSARSQRDRGLTVAPQLRHFVELVGRSRQHRCREARRNAQIRRRRSIAIGWRASRLRSLGIDEGRMRRAGRARTGRYTGSIRFRPSRAPASLSRLAASARHRPLRPPGRGPMTLRIHNSLTRVLEPFAPIEPGHVRMYVCGMTIYDLCHIGHARSLIAFDMVQRWLRGIGYASPMCATSPTSTTRSSGARSSSGDHDRALDRRA